MDFVYTPLAAISTYAVHHSFHLIFTVFSPRKRFPMDRNQWGGGGGGGADCELVRLWDMSVSLIFEDTFSGRLFNEFFFYYLQGINKSFHHNKYLQNQRRKVRIFKSSV